MIKALTGPIARIILRYGVGIVLGASVGNALAADPDVVTVVAVAVGVGVETVYAIAKRRGWKL